MSYAAGAAATTAAAGATARCAVAIGAAGPGAAAGEGRGPVVITGPFLIPIPALTSVRRSAKPAPGWAGSSAVEHVTLIMWSRVRSLPAHHRSRRGYVGRVRSSTITPQHTASAEGRRDRDGGRHLRRGRGQNGDRRARSGGTRTAYGSSRAAVPEARWRRGVPRPGSACDRARLRSQHRRPCRSVHRRGYCRRSWCRLPAKSRCGRQRPRARSRPCGRLPRRACCVRWRSRKG